jgi:rSAM/selenodomain-associated transferase 2
MTGRSTIRSNLVQSLNATRIAVVIPVLNEDAAALGQSLMSAIGADEIIVVDGGSEEQKLNAAREVCSNFGALLVGATKGRALQMNAGAKLTNAEWLIFLHADVQLPSDWRQQLITQVEQNPSLSSPQWGRFDVRFRDVYTHDANRLAWLFGMYVVGSFMNARSRLTAISTGDQAQFIRSRSFVAMNGFPEQPLMEDVEFSKRAIIHFGKPVNLSSTVSVSARRWHHYGYFRTIALMWKLRWQYWRGVTPIDLHKAYYGKS